MAVFPWQGFVCFAYAEFNWDYEIGRDCDLPSGWTFVFNFYFLLQRITIVLIFLRSSRSSSHINIFHFSLTTRMIFEGFDDHSYGDKIFLIILRDVSLIS